MTSAPWRRIRPRVGMLEARDHPQGRRLAGAGRAEHREELAVADLEVDAGHRDDGFARAGLEGLRNTPTGSVIPELLDDPFETNGGDR